MKQIRNLYDELMEVAVGPHLKPEAKNWAKTVQQVNMDIQNGWMYTGDFIKSGTIEVEIEPTVFIVMTSVGEKEVPLYQVITMDDEGELEKTGIHTLGDVPGWAMRIRDDIIDLLLEMEIRGVMELEAFGNVIPQETIDLLEKDAIRALDTGDDVPVYPDVLLALINHYRERMRLR